MPYDTAHQGAYSNYRQNAVDTLYFYLLLALLLACLIVFSMLLYLIQCFLSIDWFALWLSLSARLTSYASLKRPLFPCVSWSFALSTFMCVCGYGVLSLSVCVTPILSNLVPFSICPSLMVVVIVARVGTTSLSLSPTFASRTCLFLLVAPSLLSLSLAACLSLFPYVLSLLVYVLSLCVASPSFCLFVAFAFSVVFTHFWSPSVSLFPCNFLSFAPSSSLYLFFQLVCLFSFFACLSMPITVPL